MRKFLIPIYILVVVTSLAGCSVYEPTIRQGNVIERDEFEQIKPGMTRKQVQFILGTPLLVDPFRRDRWDYVYYVLDKKTRKQEYQRITLIFDDDTLKTIEGDVTVQNFRESPDPRGQDSGTHSH